MTEGERPIQKKTMEQKRAELYGVEKTELENFEKMVLYTEQVLYPMVKRHYPKAKLVYNVGYYAYFGLTDMNEPEIFIPGTKWKNNRVSLSSYMCLDMKGQKPFRVFLWKYNGNHFDESWDLDDLNIDEDWLIGEIERFIFGREPHGQTQMSLFEMGAQTEKRQKTKTVRQKVESGYEQLTLF